MLNTMSLPQNRSVDIASVEAPSEQTRRWAPKWLVISAFAAVYLVWGSTYLGIHVAIQSIPPFLMAGTRFALAGLLLYPVIRLRGAPRPKLAHWGNAAVIGGLLLFMGNGGVTWGEQTVPSGITALMIAAVSLWMNLFEWLRPNGKAPATPVLIGLALGFAGVAFIALGKDQHGNALVNPFGATALLVAAVCWALGSIYSQHAQQNESALLNVAMQMICGGLLMVLAGMVAGETSQLKFNGVTSSSAWAFIYLTLVGSLVGFTAYVWLLQVSTPARVSSYAYVNPLVAVFLGRIILNEPLPKSVLMAGGLIICSVVLITTAKAKAGRA